MLWHGSKLCLGLVQCTRGSDEIMLLKMGGVGVGCLLVDLRPAASHSTLPLSSRWLPTSPAPCLSGWQFWVLSLKARREGAGYGPDPCDPTNWCRSPPRCPINLPPSSSRTFQVVFWQHGWVPCCRGRAQHAWLGPLLPPPPWPSLPCLRIHRCLSSFLPQSPGAWCSLLGEQELKGVSMATAGPAPYRSV